MSAIVLSRILSAIVVFGGGMAIAHVMLPYGPDKGVAWRAAFYLIVAGIAWLRGLRDATVRGGFSPRARAIRASIFAAVSVVVALGAYFVMHGNPIR